MPKKVIALNFLYSGSCSELFEKPMSDHSKFCYSLRVIIDNNIWIGNKDFCP